MPFVDAVPTDAPVVVRYTEAWLRGRYEGSFILCVAAAGGTLGAGAITMGYSVLGGLALLLASAGFVALAVQNRRRRRLDRSATVLVANADGVWLTLEAAAGRRILHLPWTQIKRVRRASWSGASGRQVHYVCFDAPGTVAPGVPSGASLGTPFVVSETGKDTDTFALLRGLVPLAGAAGVEVDPVLPI
jgi:hypothetical protein